MWDKSKKTDLLQILIPDKRRPKVRFFGNFKKEESGTKLKISFATDSRINGGSRRNSLGNKPKFTKI